MNSLILNLLLQYHFILSILNSEFSTTNFEERTVSYIKNLQNLNNQKDSVIKVILIKALKSEIGHSKLVAMANSNDFVKINEIVSQRSKDFNNTLTECVDSSKLKPLKQNRKFHAISVKKQRSDTLSKTSKRKVLSSFKSIHIAKE